MREKIGALLCCLMLTLFLSGVSFAEGGGGGDPAPKDPKCRSTMIER